MNKKSNVTVDSHGGDLITVTEPSPGDLDTRVPVRDTEWQGQTRLYIQNEVVSLSQEMKERDMKRLWESPCLQ